MALRLRRREIAKHQLGQSLSAGFIPDRKDLTGGLIDFERRVVGHRAKHQAKVERRLSALPGDLEHVVFPRGDVVGLQFFGPDRK